MIGPMDDAQVASVVAAILLLGTSLREGAIYSESSRQSWGYLPSAAQADEAVLAARTLLVLARTQQVTRPDPLAG